MKTAAIILGLVVLLFIFIQRIWSSKLKRMQWENDEIEAHIRLKVKEIRFSEEDPEKERMRLLVLKALETYGF